jgi:FMN-dependent oxidoreductase (nitrilotriacetate monooxygenase family)
MSTTYHHPFYVARLFNALDHVTGGRVAWNAVTSAYKNEAANWGYAEMMPHAERYDRAQEHMAVVRKLWNSVERDAIVMDKQTGRFADSQKVHRIDHAGEHFNVPGPLPCMPSPQYHPVVVQAGQSAPGMNLCATHADLQFASRATVDGMRKHRKNLDDLLAAKGRDPRDVGIMWSLRVCPNESPEIVREKDEEWRASLPERTGVILLSSIYGVDFSKIDPQTPVREVGAQVRKHITHTGMFDEIFAAADPTLTLDQFGFNALTDHMTLAGSPTQIADQIEEIHEASNQCGGIIISTKARPVPGFLQDFVEYVVPELQRRGLSKTQYEGTTLRDNLGIRDFKA